MAGATLAYLSDPGAPLTLGAELAAPVSVALGVTALLAAVLWRTRTSVRLGWVMLYLVVVVTSVAILGIRNERFDHAGNGFPYAGLARGEGRWDALRAEVVRRDFILESGRHLAPRARLRGVLDRVGFWTLREDVPKAGRADSWPPFEVHAVGVSPAERELLGRWVRQWQAEVSHAALALAVESRPAIRLSVGNSIPIWRGDGVEAGRSSFDHPPATALVREAMVRARAKADAGIASYLDRQLQAADALDERVGLAPDPVLAEVRTR